MSVAEVKQQQADLQQKRDKLTQAIDQAAIDQLNAQKKWNASQVDQALGKPAPDIDKQAKATEKAKAKVTALRRELPPLDLAREHLLTELAAAKREEQEASLALSARNAERFEILRDEAGRAAARAVAVAELAFSGSSALGRLEYAVQVVFGGDHTKQLSILGFRDRFDQMLTDARLAESKL